MREGVHGESGRGSGGREREEEKGHLTKDERKKKTTKASSFLEDKQIGAMDKCYIHPGNPKGVLPSS